LSKLPAASRWPSQQPLPLNPFFPNGSNNGNPWQGQRNIHIVASGGGGQSRRVQYDFFAANPETRGGPSHAVKCKQISGLNAMKR
jgi:hypothetical protein